MMIILALIAALLPAVLLWLYIWWKDTRPEPTSWLGKAVVAGCVIIIPVLILEYGITWLIFGDNGEPVTIFRATVEAFIVAALPEETFKLLALWLVLRKNPYFDEHFDGIVYAVCVGLGFAAVENVLFVLNEEDWVSILAHGVYDFLSLSGKIDRYTGVICFPLLIWFCVKMHKNARTKVLALVEKDNQNRQTLDYIE